jgi:hypothetical protein
MQAGYSAEDVPAYKEETHEPLVALALCTAAGLALAQDDDATLSPIVVERANANQVIIACEPPNGALECARFHELIRQNFTPREIGMLFGGSTAYLEYPTSYDRTRERYVAFLRDLQENGVPVVVGDNY